MTDMNLNGYGDVKWGDSIEDIKRLYPNIEDRTLEEERKEGILFFEMKNDTGIMTSQGFYFYHGKLYSVTLFFDNIDVSSGEMLLQKFIEKYGRPGNPKIFKHWVNEDVFSENVIVSRSISPEMVIYIHNKQHINKFTEEVVATRHRYSYVNQKIADQIEIDNAKKNVNNIIL